MLTNSMARQLDTDVGDAWKLCGRQPAHEHDNNFIIMIFEHVESTGGKLAAVTVSGGVYVWVPS